MERATFLKLAPDYYMLALCMHFDYPRDLHGEASFSKDFTIQDEMDGEYLDLTENAPLRREALRRLDRAGAIKLVDDPFGPTLWQRGPNLETLQEEWEKTPSSVFYKARMSGDRREWLMVALPNVNRTAADLNVVSADFDVDAVSELAPKSFEGTDDTQVVDQWAPITIDQTDPVVVEATKQLAAATDAIERDNGYSVTHPQERDAMVADLKGGLEKLKSGVISTGWMRRTIVSLKQASFRFANTVKGQTIDGALLAIKEVVKAHMSHALEYLWSLLP